MIKYKNFFVILQSLYINQGYDKEENDQDIQGKNSLVAE